jgi:copper homeostasis protein CutC
MSPSVTLHFPIARAGGTTPSIGTVQLCKELLKIPIMVMIRPRGGDFCYTDVEMEIMKVGWVVVVVVGMWTPSDGHHPDEGKI